MREVIIDLGRHQTERVRGMRILCTIAIGFAALTWSHSDAAEEIPARVPTRLAKQLDCMVQVVKSAPDTNQIESGISKEPMNLDRPYVSWHYSGSQGPADIRFDGLGTVDTSLREKLSYLAIFANGLQPEGPDGKPPPGWKPTDWGAGKIIDRWKSSCGTWASILSF